MCNAVCTLGLSANSQGVLPRAHMYIYFNNRPQALELYKLHTSTSIISIILMTIKKYHKFNNSAFLSPNASLV